MRSFVLFFILLFSLQGALASDLDDIYQQARRYWNKDWNRCAELLEKALTMAEDEVGQEDEFYAVLLNDLAVSYWHIGDLELAEEYLKQAIEIKGETLGPDDPLYAASVINAAGIYESLGDYAKAEEYYENGITIFREFGEEDSDSYMSALNNYGLFLQTLGGYIQAEELFYESLDLAELNHGKSHVLYANALSNLGNLYTKTGNYEAAQEYLQQALLIYETDPNKYVDEYSTSLSNLGLLYENTGNFGEAEQLYLKVLNIQQNTKPESAEHGQVLGNLAVLYRKIGNGSKALEYLTESRQILRSAVGINHPDYGVATNNLAEYYKNIGELEKAEKMYQEAANIFRLSYSDSHPLYATAINNLASLYRRKGDYNKALELYKKSIEIDEKTVGVDHPTYATSLSNLALLHFSMGNHSAAEPLFQKALQIRESALNSKHPSYSRSLSNLGLFYLSQGKIEESEPYFIKGINTQLEQIRSIFPSLSEKEKEDYYNLIKEDIERFNTVAVVRSQTNPAIVANMYNHQLATKAILFNATEKMRRNILTSQDEDLIEQFNKWQSVKRDLTRYYQYTEEELEAQGINLQILESMANDLEKKISLKSSVFALNAQIPPCTWQDVQAQLKPGEAAVEIIRFREFRSGEGGRIGFSNKIYYAALIVTTETVGQPKMVLYQNGNQLDGRYWAYYKNAFRFRVEDWYSYGQYWLPLKKELAGIRKVYFSPDGIFSSVNMNALYNRDADTYVIDELDICYVTNTKDIVVDKQFTESSSDLAVMIGNPDFMMEPDRRERIIKDGFPSRYNSELHSYNHLSEISYGTQYVVDLPGSEEEIEEISEIIGIKGWSRRTFLGANALEEVVKGIKNPKVLHIATHGFFSEPRLSTGYLRGVSKNNPLFMSGLMLGGSGNSLYRGENDISIPRNVEDGLLTAYEAMNLSLEGTELVVLSACETGLGDAEDGEGINGLERALKVAGASTIVMSLFKVDDWATKNLMTNFYSEWMKTEDKRLAFRNAQIKSREQNPEPYYWAPFIMVGH